MSDEKKAVTISPQEDFRRALERQRPELEKALPSHIDSAKFLRVAQTAVLGNPDLLNLDRKSLFEACQKAAQDGLLPDGREAALVKFGNKAVYMPMLAGILKKVRNSGELLSITAHVIYKNDKFRYWVDTDGEHLEHEPLLFGARGEIIGVYALAKTKDGGLYIEPMSKEQIDKVRNASRSGQSGPWKDWYDEMAKKTVLRRLAKRLPMSTDLDVFKADDEIHQAVVSEPPPVEPKKSRLAKIVEESVPPVITTFEPPPQREPGDEEVPI